MTYSLSFELLGLPRMANLGDKSHWRHADRERKVWQTHVAAAVLRGGRPPKPLTRAHLVLTRFSATPPDFDGLVRGFKSVVDGLVVAGVLADDKLENTGNWDCRWVKAKPKQGKISVVVTEIREGETE